MPKKLTVTIDDELDKAIDIYQQEKGKTREELVQEALKSYLTGEVVNWREIRGDHIIATLKLISYIRKLDYELEREKTQIMLRSKLAELEEFANIVKQIEEKKGKKAEEEDKNKKLEEILYYMLLGLGQRLGLIEVEFE